MSSARLSPTRSDASIRPDGRGKPPTNGRSRHSKMPWTRSAAPSSSRIPRRRRDFRRSPRGCGRVGRLRLQCHIRGVGIRCGGSVRQYEFRAIRSLGQGGARLRFEQRSEQAPVQRGSRRVCVQPLEQTVLYAGDVNFPRSFNATYLGETRAVDRNWRADRPRFYDGEIDITVRWTNTVSGSSVHAVIRNLAGVLDGTPFEYNGRDVYEIVISGMSVRLDSDRRMGYSTSSPTVRIRYFDVGRPDSRYFGTRTHEGKFVGYSIDGPVGVIGTWRLGAIKGAYGADLTP